MTNNNKNQDEILAEKGDPQAQLRVGVSYLENSENLQDLRRALSYLRKSAIQNNALAQYTLGVVHERGKGVDQDVVTSLKWFFIAAEAGHKQAQLFTKELRPNITTKQVQAAQNLATYFNDAVMLYKASIVKKKPEWQYKLGYLFEEGLGVDKDHAEAIHWYKLAHDQKHIPAHVALGKLYFAGLGVERDAIRAVELFTMSSDNGNPDGHYYLGYAYETASGVTQNLEEAYELYLLAAEQDHELALLRLGLMFRNGINIKSKMTEVAQESQKKYGITSKYDEVIEKKKEWYSQDYEKALGYFKRSADKGNPEAQCNLGLFYAQALGVTQDFDLAIKYFRQAASQGHAESMSNLAFMYAHGQSVNADYHKAAMWYEVSRRLGFNTIQKNMEFVFTKLTTEQAQAAQTLASNCMEVDYKGYN